MEKKGEKKGIEKERKKEGMERKNKATQLQNA